MFLSCAPNAQAKYDWDTRQTDRAVEAVFAVWKAWKLASARWDHVYIYIYICTMDLYVLFERLHVERILLKLYLFLENPYYS